MIKLGLCIAGGVGVFVFMHYYYQRKREEQFNNTNEQVNNNNRNWDEGFSDSMFISDNRY
jgi:preprotein translocase subunit YajC